MVFTPFNVVKYQICPSTEFRAFLTDHREHGSEYGYKKLSTGPDVGILHGFKTEPNLKTRRYLDFVFFSS